MGRNTSKEFQLVHLFQWLVILGLTFGFCPDLLASQEAIVVADSAVIYSDVEMTSPVGYIKRGKKVKIGEVARNKNQVYPIVVSGKVAYIRRIDISTEKEAINSENLVAERFQRSTQVQRHQRYSFSYYNFMSKVDMDSKHNGGIRDQDDLVWQGYSFKGDAQVKGRWSVVGLFNFMVATQREEQFRVFEVGLGGSFRIIEVGRFDLKAETMVIGIPFSSYAVGSDFRVNGYGYGMGGGGNASFRFSENWGVEAYAGIYSISIFNYDAPEPYTDMAPSFIGTRYGLGLNYTF